MRALALGLLALLSPLSSLPYASATSELPQMAGETVLSAEGSRHGKFYLPQSGTLVGVSITSESPSFVLYVTGPGYYWRIGSGGYYIDVSDFNHQISQAFPPGSYHIYLITDPPAHAAATLTISGVNGSVSAALTDPVSSDYRNLSPMLPTPTSGIMKFTGVQSFQGRAYSGFFVREETLPGSYTGSPEFRWSGPDGVHVCGSFLWFGANGGTSSLAGGIVPDGGYSPVQLAYIRNMAAVYTLSEVKGFWFSQADDDLTPGDPGVVTPPLWGIAAVDYDFHCQVPRLARMLD